MRALWDRRAPDTSINIIARPIISSIPCNDEKTTIVTHFSDPAKSKTLASMQILDDAWKGCSKNRLGNTLEKLGILSKAFFYVYIGWKEGIAIAMFITCFVLSVWRV